MSAAIIASPVKDKCCIGLFQSGILGAHQHSYRNHCHPHLRPEAQLREQGLHDTHIVSVIMRQMFSDCSSDFQFLISSLTLETESKSPFLVKSR